MLGSMYGNGLILIGLWVATSLVVLFLWGLLAWAVVTMLSRRGSARDGRVAPTDEVCTGAQRTDSSIGGSGEPQVL
jgi:hypothetical protein